MFLKKSNAIVLSDCLGIQKLVAGSPERQLTTILYHQFFFGEENRDIARDRLKRQCEWLVDSYSPVTATQAVNSLGRNDLSGYSLLVTIDDAKLQVLDVLDIFESFEIPLVLFVCPGWSDRGNPIDESTALMRAVATLHWYDGPAVTIESGGLSVQIETGMNTKVIDKVLEAAENDAQFSAVELAESLDRVMPGSVRQVCNWSEITDLASRGVEIGSHAVSHVRLAEQSDRRLRYEISESKKALSAKIGTCAHFAYPYGDPGTFDERTVEALRQSGYSDGFITRVGFANGSIDPCELPRITMPEAVMGQAEFRARVRGGGIPFSVIKKFVS
ncbi:MAG TPA: polysaccharide deacetylase family protein [Rhodospirillales bacterium]|nr:polysaccharide deacetylase family protein [Rhodospirillales bacterium]